MVKLQPRQWLIFLLVVVGVLLSTMDSSMINIALPTIMREFGRDLAEVQSLVLVYLLVVSCSLVFWGALADRYGKGTVFMTGIIFFAVAAGCCAIADSLPLLIFLRGCQAIGAAMMMSTGPAIIKLTFPKDQLGQGLGLVGIATSLGLMSGPPLAGYLVGHFSWRAIFLVPLPLCAIALLLGFLFLLPTLRTIDETRIVPYDWQGGILWTGLVASCVALSQRMPEQGPFVKVLLIGISILFLWLFIKHERRVPYPILPGELISKRYFWTAIVCAAISFAALFVVILLTPFYLDYVLKSEIKTIGWVMAALPVSLVVVSPLSGWLYDRIGRAKYLSTFGLAVSATALALVTSWDEQTSRVQVAGLLVLLGAGQAIFLSPNSASVFSQVTEQYAGITAGILATARNSGMLLGTVVVGSLFPMVLARVSGGGVVLTLQLQHIPAFLTALHITVGTMTVVLLIGCAISLLRR